ncbi:hypothetical protein [Roseicyclus marinus]|uniref:hypothetical protein n=1 Tax=Roseicyclus marinus TaxID=2161673 RepID=UPI0024E0E411|nr:hypothetical protein [Roseicyclus marinus]MDG3040423.1 hypothetical protein [Roseicyclus marinus]
MAAKVSEALSAQVRGAVVGERVDLRITDAPRIQGYQRLLNNYFHGKDWVLGNVCMFASGQMQALLRITDGLGQKSLIDVLKELEIAESKAPTGHEYLQGISYWMIIGDHLYQIQHVSLQVKALEEYLTWLLRDQSKVIEEKHCVLLDSSLDQRQTGFDLGDVTSIEIGGLVPETVRSPPATAVINELVPTDIDEHKSLVDRVKAQWQTARKVVEAVLGDAEADKIFASVPPEAALEVNVSIGYRSRRRKFNKEFMGNIASGLRNVPDGELIVKGKHGRVKGDDARLSHDMPIKTVNDNSNLLDLEDVRKQILEVHRRFLHDGLIS